MKNELNDIQHRQDLVRVLTEFYIRVEHDEIIGNKFVGLNMSEHIEIIADFWSSIIFGSNSYKGDPFGKHLVLNLEAKDFEQWLGLFKTTIDNRFKGKNATEMINRAQSIASIFQYKLGLKT